MNDPFIQEVVRHVTDILDLGTGDTLRARTLEETVVVDPTTGARCFETRAFAVRTPDGYITGITETRQCATCADLMSHHTTRHCTSCGKALCQACAGTTSICKACTDATFWDRVGAWLTGTD